MGGTMAPQIISSREDASDSLRDQLRAANQRHQELLRSGASTEKTASEIVDLTRELRSSPFREGTVLGHRFLLERKLGRGGYGVVWEAIDRDNADRRVALKVLHRDIAGDPTALEHFVRGATVMRELEHPAVVKVVTPVNKDQGYYYFAMEFMPKGDLRNLIRLQQLTSREAYAIILSVGDALAFAHARRRTHRDVKPSNILLDTNNNAKLADFDLVSALDSTGGTRTGALGSSIYAAPEQRDSEREAGPAADVYSLGLTLIYCLRGKDPVVERIVDLVPSLGCSEQVKSVLLKAISWQVEHRFADAAEFVRALRAALAEQANDTVPSDLHTSTPTSQSARALPTIQQENATNAPTASAHRSRQDVNWSDDGGDDLPFKTNRRGTHAAGIFLAVGALISVAWYADQPAALILSPMPTAKPPEALPPKSTAEPVTSSPSPVAPDKPRTTKYATTQARVSLAAAETAANECMARHPMEGQQVKFQQDADGKVVGLHHLTRLSRDARVCLENFLRTR